MGDADEGHRADGVDDRTPVRDRLREARAQQAAFETDHRPFRAAEAQRPAVEFVLRVDSKEQPTRYGFTAKLVMPGLVPGIHSCGISTRQARGGGARAGI